MEEGANQNNSPPPAPAVVAATTMVTRSSNKKKNAVEPSEQVVVAAVASSSNKKDDHFDLSEYLHQITEDQENVVRSDDEKEAMSSMDITKKHFKRANEVERSFIVGIAAICEYSITRTMFLLCIFHSPVHPLILFFRHKRWQTSLGKNDRDGRQPALRRR